MRLKESINDNYLVVKYNHTVQQQQRYTKIKADRQLAQLDKASRYDLLLLLDKGLISLSQAMVIFAVDKYNWQMPDITAEQLVQLALYVAPDLSPGKSINIFGCLYLRIRSSDNKAVLIYNAPNAMPVQSLAILHWGSDRSQALNRGIWKDLSNAKDHASQFLTRINRR